IGSELLARLRAVAERVDPDLVGMHAGDRLRMLLSGAIGVDDLLQLAQGLHNAEAQETYADLAGHFCGIRRGGRHPGGRMRILVWLGSHHPGWKIEELAMLLIMFLLPHADDGAGGGAHLFLAARAVDVKG